MNTLFALAGGALLVAASWLLLAMTLAGVGLLVRRLWLGSQPVELHEAFALIWTGYAVALLVLQVLHFFRPIDSWALGILVAVGTIGIVSGGRNSRLALPDPRFLAGNRVPLLTFALFVLWAANRCTGPLTMYDSGMYHAPAVEWFKAYPIVPGLGNLHGRLAFNPSSLLFAAMLDRGPFMSGANHLANGFILVVLVADVLRRGVRLVRGDRSRTRSDIIAVVLLPALLMMFVRQDARSLSTDVVVTALLMATGLRLYESLQYPSLVRRQRAYDLTVLALMASAAVCVKLSAAPFAAGAMVLAAYAARRAPGVEAITVRQLFTAAALPVLLVGTWLMRGVILSGYPLYPVRLLVAPVEWRVPAEQAGAEAAWVQMSARYLNTNNIGIGFDWLSFWIGDILTRGDLVVHITVPLLIVLGVAAAVLVRRRRQGVVRAGATLPDEMRPARSALLLGALLCATAVIWFFSAPHTRFGQSTFWLAAGLAVSVQLSPAVNAGNARSARARRWLVRGVAGLAGVLFAGHAAGIVRRGEARFSWRSIGQELVTIPVSGMWLQPMPAPRLVPFVTASGLRLHVPETDNSCWNGPVLCTPHPSPNLALRRDSDVASGFVTRGPWAATRFPNPWTPFLVLWRCQQEPGSLARLDRDRACLARARRTQTGNGPGT